DAPVLAPTLSLAFLIEHQRRVRPVGEDAVLLRLAVVDATLAPLRVEADAPATTEDAAVALDQVRERLPGIRPQLTDGELSHRRLPISARCDRVTVDEGLWVWSLPAELSGSFRRVDVF